MKILYLVATAKRKNRTNLTGKTNGWKTILNTPTVALRRPHRRPHPMTTVTAAYTKNLTVPW